MDVFFGKGKPPLPISRQGIDDILGLRERSTREVREDVIDDDGVTVPQ